MSQDLKQCVMTSHQIENINKKIKKYLKEPNGNSGIEKYNNQNEKFTRSPAVGLSWQKNQ